VIGHRIPLRTPRPDRQGRVARARGATVVGTALLLTVALVGPVPGAGAGSSPAPTATRDELGEGEPLNAPGQTLYLQRVTIPPGVALPEHFHEGTQVARVRTGVLTYEVLSGAVTITRRDGTVETVQGPATVKIRAGESLFEAESLDHRGSNAGKKPVVIEVGALLRTGAPLATPIGSAAEGTALTVEAELTSQATQLTNVGANGAVTYGWNRLTGTATDASGPVQVELLGSVAYRDGAGPFSGFVTFTFADGSVLGTQIQGVATKDAAGATQFASTLGVIDGTGRYLGAKGSGRFTGSRDAALGQPVKAKFEITIAPPE
jgi:hypothetical protein